MATNAKADDILNRTYLDCRPALQRYLAFSTCCQETAIKAWLFRVAANLAVDHFRKNKRHQELLSEHLPIINETEALATPETIVAHDDQLQEI